MGAYCHYILIALSDFSYNIALFDFIILPQVCDKRYRVNVEMWLNVKIFPMLTSCSVCSRTVLAINKRINLKVVKISKNVNL